MGLEANQNEPVPGGTRELVMLSLPLVLSASFWTIQIFVDRIFINGVGEEAMAAVMPAVGYFWTPMALLHNTVLYATVFVAQYQGAGRPERIGPTIRHALLIALIGGILFPALIPVVSVIIERTGHQPAMKSLELEYFSTLTLAALPIATTGALSAFFAGRGKSWHVLFINSIGTLVNAVFAYFLIYQRRHDPHAAMSGAGIAAALGSVAATLTGALMVYGSASSRKEFGLLTGKRFDPDLFERMLEFGIPNGAQWCIEGLAFTAFIILVGNIGPSELAATSITLSLNMLAFLPMMGLGQGVEVLVGKRQGENRPDLSAKTTWVGVKLATIYMIFVAAGYCFLPETLAFPFARGEHEGSDAARVAWLIPVLLRYVAAYSLADGLNLMLAYALRGAGDTRFVTLAAIGLSWPLMVIPTWLVVRYRFGLDESRTVQSAWAFATLYIIVTAGVYVLRFRSGKWRTMKVIEDAVTE